MMLRPKYWYREGSVCMYIQMYVSRRKCMYIASAYWRVRRRIAARKREYFAFNKILNRLERQPQSYIKKLIRPFVANSGQSEPSMCQQQSRWLDFKQNCVGWL